MEFQFPYNQNHRPCLPSINNVTLFHLISCCISGTKGVAKAMKEISSGAQKWEGEKWYSELSDKRMYCNFFFS